MNSPIETPSEALQLIDRARDAETCRDLDSLNSLLSQVWEDIDTTPDYSRFSEEINAELLRLSGAYLSQHGKSKGLVGQQSRASEMLEHAASIFDLIGNYEKAAEAEIARAACYWYSGEVERCDSILSSLEEEFERNHPIYLQIQINRVGCLNWQSHHDQALAVINSIYKYATSCPVQKLQVQFYNQAGITYQLTGEHEKAIDHLLKATFIARTCKNVRLLGLSLNCLSMAFRRSGDFASAHIYAKEAISVLESVGDTGWIPHVLDTRALIFLDEGRPTEALDAIDKAISLFAGSEDYSSLTDAMFTKCRCLLRLRRGPEAFALFAELGHLASVRIGETALRKYSAMLAEEVRNIAGTTLRERTDFLEKDLIREALHASDGNIDEAAKALGETQQALLLMLKSKYADLYNELGLQGKPRKTKRSAKKRENPPNRRSSMFSCPRA
jgi:tetratricopeptide (TPR) repeat protein